MRPVIILLEKLYKQGIFVNVSNNELIIKAEKGIVTEKILGEIKKNKGALLSFFLKKQAPLSFAQERLWFMDQYNHNSSYNIALAIRVLGKLDVNTLEKTLLEIIKRHEVLRTNFITLNSEPVQIIHEEPKFKLEVTEINSLVKSGAEEQIVSSIEKESRKPFDLESDSLIRVSLYKINEEEYVLFMNKHHIISDGWSFSVLTKEISLLYETFTENKPSPLSELPIQYSDYAIWQKQHLAGDLLQKQSGYWKTKLENVPVLKLPTDKIRPAEQTFNGSSLSFQLSQEISQKLILLSKESNVTLFMTLLALFKIILQKYSGQDDICVGSPIANRTRSEVEGLIGFFVNTLALRNQINNEDSFIDLLNKVKITTLNAYDNQDLPFEKIVDLAEQERSLSYPPLFQVMMVLQNNPESEPKFSGLILKPIDLKSAVSKFDLTLEFNQVENGLIGKIEYNTDLFNQATIERMINHFTTLSEQVIKNPEKQITELEILTSKEKNQLLVEWNNTELEYPGQTTIVELFEKQVRKTPNSKALIYGDQKISFKELNEQSNQLARYLISKGVESETLVGLLVERSIDFIIGVLGILKSGGAYIPIDPSYPEERINYMLEDSKASYIVTEKRFLPSISGSDASIICLDTDKAKIEKYQISNLNININIKDLLYVIYTSGSTGKPKGVMGTYKGLINRLNWGWETYPFKTNEVCCQKTSISFVDHVAEIFAPLLKGIPLHIFSESATKDVEQFISLLINNSISRIVVVPSLLKAIVEIKRELAIQFEDLRYVFCSGEPLSLQLVKEFSGEFKNTKLINVYGSSEVSADVTAYQINRFNDNDVLQYFNNLYLADTIKGYENYHDSILNPSTFTTPDVNLDFIADKFKNYRISNFPISIEEYYRKLYIDVFPYIINTACPQFIGHMTSALPDYVHDISKLISRLNQNLVKVESSKSLIFLEREALAILHKSFYSFSDEFYEYNIQKVNNNLGVISTGGTISNITALLTARNKKLFGGDAGESISSASIYSTLREKGYEDIVVLGSKLMHYSMKKATSILGLGTDNIIFIENDFNGKMDIKDLQHKINECQKNKYLIMAIVGIAGTTETGDIDPLEAIAEVAGLNNIHFHVDAAWGGTTIFSDKYKNLLEGIEKADSITLCGHKQLFLPQGISVCLFRDPLQAGYSTTLARYQATPNSYDFGRFTIEGSRSALSLCLHSSLRVIGKKGYELLVDNGIRMAQLFADIINSLDEFELIKYPQINILNYRYIPVRLREKVKTNSYSKSENEEINDVNTKIQECQFYKGKTFVSKTTLDAKSKDYALVVFRVVLSNPLTSRNDLILIIKDQLSIANELFDDDNNPDIENSIEAIKDIDVETLNDNQLEEEELSISIGKPLPNIKAYILDANHRLVPIGVAGELCIAGAGLSRGYLGNDKLTNEKFIDNPYGTNEKIYKTGDLARWLPDGNIQFLGRIDNQIKIRGFRIELGEIESALTSQDEIKSSVVIAKDDKAGNKRLIAYIIPAEENTGLNIEKLRESLSRTLPDYMVPSLFVKLEEIPLTSNGKVDRKALPDPEGNIEKTHEYVAPQTEVERKLAQIWKEVLGVERVGIHDNFFELGGHSLLATKIISKIRTEFNNELPLKVLFENTTIKGLSKSIDTSQLGQNKVNKIPVALSEGNFPLSYAQKRLYFLYDINKASTAYNMPIVTKLDGDFNKEMLAEVFNKLIDRHESLRTSFQLVNNEPIQKIEKQVKIEIEYFQSQEEGIQPIVDKFVRPFDLSQAPLLRVGVVETKLKEKIMLVDIHHIITDKVSNTILKDDFYKIYQGNALAPLAIQYKDYAVWQHAEEQQTKILKQEKFWLKELHGSLPILKIPTDFPRTNHESDQGGFVSVYLSLEENALVSSYCKKHGITTNMLIYSVFSILLSKLSGQKDLIIGLSISGRNYTELEEIVGMFVNSLPIRSFPDHNKPAKDFIQEVKATLLLAYDNQEYPFSSLTEKLRVQRAIGRNPIFDVMLNFIENINSMYDLSTDQSNEFIHSAGTKRFDLTLNVTQYLNTLYLEFQYDASLFRSETVEVFLRYLKNIISSLNTIDARKLYEINLENEAAIASVYDELITYPFDRSSPTELVPASYHQERLWFIDKFESGYLYQAGPVYHNVPLIVNLKGSLDLLLVEQSIRTIINRHEILRTQIITVDERPFQKIIEDFDFKLNSECLNGGDEEVNALIDEEIKKPFELDKLFVRASIYNYDISYYKLVIILHHSLVDRYSVTQLAEEIFSVYSSLLNGEEVAQGSQLQYADFSVWQQKYLSKLDFHWVSYWKHQLGGKLKALELPTDRTRATIHIYNGASLDLMIPSDTINKILKYETASGIDVNIILMAAFNVLLYKYANQNEIVIGSSLNNRNHDCLKRVVGPIANLVVVRSFISSEDCFSDYVRTLKDTYNEGVNYQSLPFDKLVTILAPEKDMSRTALFDVLYQYEDNRLNISAIEGVDISVSDSNVGYGKYDINLLLKRNEKDEIRGQLVYNSDYYDPSTMNSFIEHFYEVLKQLLTKPSSKLSDIEVLTKQEKYALIDEFDHSAVDYPKDKTIIDLFVAQVMRTPDNIAIKEGDQFITYKDLDKRSTQLSVLLSENGVQANQPVALLTDRSIETIIGMLAILKAGGAYLPIDVDYPEERIKYMIENSGSRILLTTKGGNKELVNNIPTLFIEDLENVSPDKAIVEYTNTPSDLCYIIYTSGTTGNPKGVMVEHRNVVRLFFNDKFQFDFSSNDVWTMFHSHCFDFSVWEIYGALLFGGKLIVIPKQVAKDTVTYLNILKENGVTVLNQTPSAFYNLTHHELSAAGEKLQLRYVIFGGEALTPGKLKKWRERYPDVRLINMYGITETTVHVTYKEIGEDEIEQNICNIGRPIPTLSAYIFDENMNLTPKGVKGELYVGGAGVSRGYIGNVELTTQRFISNPFNLEERLYKSGDLVRILSTGELEYIGRIDNQVQLRGFRIELGEIECNLLLHNTIKEAVVIAREKGEDKFLIAYYVSDEELETSILKNHLSDKLPDYMVPSYFVHLENLPLTSNGKLDRDILPDPVLKAGKEYVAPSTEIECRLALLWQEALRIEEVSVYDNFFELGGHSLMATQVISKIRSEFNMELPLKVLFENSTIKNIARHIESNEFEVKSQKIEMKDYAQEDKPVDIPDGYEEIEF